MSPSPAVRPTPPARPWYARLPRQPHAVFLCLALTFGLGVLAANPPFQAPDEWENFYRAFQVSEGTIVGEKSETGAGGMLPGSLGFAAAPMGIAFHPERKMSGAIFRQMLYPIFTDWHGAPRGFMDFRHTVIYAPVGYAPQALGIDLGKLLTLGDLGVMYLARLAGFAACVGLGYTALRRMPFYRWSLMLLLLAPMGFYLMGSIAQDGVLIGEGALFVAVLAGLAANPGRAPTRGECAQLLVLAALMPIAKFVYLPMACLALVAVLPPPVGVGGPNRLRRRVRPGLLAARLGLGPRNFLPLYPGTYGHSTRPGGPAARGRPCAVGLRRAGGADAGRARWRHLPHGSRRSRLGRHRPPRLVLPHVRDRPAGLHRGGIRRRAANGLVAATAPACGRPCLRAPRLSRDVRQLERPRLAHADRRDPGALLSAAGSAGPDRRSALGRLARSGLGSRRAGRATRGDQCGRVPVGGGYTLLSLTFSGGEA